MAFVLSSGASPGSPAVEAGDLKSLQRGFESHPGYHPTMKKTLLLVVALVAILTLGGCNVLRTTYTDHERDGGITPAQAEEQLLAIEGVTSADYRTEEYYSPGEGGLFSSEGMDIYLEVTIDPEYSIADPEEFYGFLAPLAWSVNDHYPQGSVTVSIEGGIDRGYEWGPAVVDVLGLDEDAHYYPIRSDDISWHTRAFGEAFGRWPGERVETPTGLLLDKPPIVETAPAIADARIVLESGPDGTPCYVVSFERLDGDYGSYDGGVDVRLLDDTGVEVDAIVASPDLDRVEFCYSEAESPSDPSATLTAEPTLGFEETWLTAY